MKYSEPFLTLSQLKGIRSPGTDDFYYDFRRLSSFSEARNHIIYNQRKIVM